MSPKLILITGGTGFVGQAVVPRLLKEGYRVRCIIRPTSTWPFAEHPELERVVGDMRDADSLDGACAGVDGICHLAAAKSDERESAHINSEGAMHLRKAAEKHHVSFLINISTQSAKLSKQGLYAKTKSKADTIFSGSSVPVTTLMPSLVLGGKGSGAFETVFRMTRLPLIPVFGGGVATYYPIHREDLAELIVRTMERSDLRGITFDAGGPESITLRELIEQTTKLRGRSAIIIPVPLGLGLILAKIFSILPRPPFTLSNVLGGAEAVTMDSTPLYRAAGCTPRPLPELLKAEVALLEAHRQRDPIAEECPLLARYLLPPSARRWQPGPVEAEWYRTALQEEHIANHQLGNIFRRFPFLLGGLDAITRKNPTCALQRKLMTIATLIECHPVSARWLLPRDRSRLSVAIGCIGAILRSAGKLLIGILLILIPGFIRRHAS